MTLYLPISSLQVLIYGPLIWILSTVENYSKWKKKKKPNNKYLLLEKVCA